MLPTHPPSPGPLGTDHPAAGPPEVAIALPWRTWNAALEEARQRVVPILALAEPTWTNSAQRLAFILARDHALRSLLDEAVVPALVTPDERPDLMATWRRVSAALTGTAGPPLLVFLTHEGLPFLTYPTMTFEGDAVYPSLASLVQSTAEEYAGSPDRFAEEARRLLAAPEPEVPVGDGDDWSRLHSVIDTTHGGVNELPKHPRPSLLWTMLAAQEQGSLPDDLVRWLEQTLRSMIRGGIYDQIDRGFHRCARDARWVLPHFEKPVPLNAQLAAVYARARNQMENERFGDVARHLLSFCAAALRDDVDAIGSDSAYYTWTSGEMLKLLDPSLVQVMSLHYDIQPIHERQVLHRVVEMEEMDRYSHESVDVLSTRLMRGRTQLRAARQRRPAPPLVSLPALCWRAETIRWMLMAAAWAKVDVPPVIAALERLINGRLVAQRGYSRRNEAESEPAVWLEDQASLLAAFVVAHRVIEEPHWLERARELADILLAVWWADGGWLDRPDAASPSRAVIDDAVPSPLTTLVDALHELGEVTGEPGYAERASQTATLARSRAIASGHWSALIPE